MPALSRLVFVHGFRHGSWCWSEVGIMLGTTALTRDGWGSVRRTYLTCAGDAAIGRGRRRHPPRLSPPLSSVRAAPHQDPRVP